jgi:hypothetical protein
VQLFARRSDQATAVPIGEGVTDASGHWRIMASRLGDGTYAITVRLSGSDQMTRLTQVIVDTVAPRITAGTYNRKTGRVTVSFDDPTGLDPDSLANPAFFVVKAGKGSKSGTLMITGLKRIGAQEVTFSVKKGRRHPSSILLQVVSGGIRDRAGNGLDGEFSGTFPTGTGQTRGDFVARLPVVKPRAGKTHKARHRSKG